MADGEDEEKCSKKRNPTRGRPTPHSSFPYRLRQGTGSSWKSETGEDARYWEYCVKPPPTISGDCHPGPSFGRWVVNLFQISSQGVKEGQQTCHPRFPDQGFDDHICDQPICFVVLFFFSSLSNGRGSSHGLL
jgi:hypothetical protein